MSLTCSKVKPFVSGTKIQAKRAQKKHVEPHTKNTRTPIPFGPSTMKGVMTPMIPKEGRTLADV